MHNHDQLTASLGRRELILRTAGAFSLFGLGAVATRSARADTSTVVLTPQEEQGPFFVDGQLERADIIYDTTTKTVQPGLPLFLKLTFNQVTSGVVSPLTGARIDLWSANASGVYSDEASENSSGENFLRGYQITNTSGQVEFLTIYPGWYSGRTPHIHCIVRLFSGSTATFEFITQFFFTDALTEQVYKLSPYSARASEQNTTNVNDRVFNYEDCTTLATSGDELMLTIARTTSTYMIAEYTLDIDLTAPKPTCIGVSDGGINE